MRTSSIYEFPHFNMERLYSCYFGVVGLSPRLSDWGHCDLGPLAIGAAKGYKGISSLLILLDFPKDKQTSFDMHKFPKPCFPQGR
jgi:hypothetical protein